ncbi:hypothetical protein ILUMI_17693 [Ignelater luminosus]|uniref:Uncharacterized protein n=1 Tax=Ignelater luminosus TaxID=2038154 RepID=A0A8K0G1M1_IGNLU|nr:hypothetical protein ILUMI_17693 [Ignelater luminosus]
MKKFVVISFFLFINDVFSSEILECKCWPGYDKTIGYLGFLECRKPMTPYNLFVDRLPKPCNLPRRPECICSAIQEKYLTGDGYFCREGNKLNKCENFQDIEAYLYKLQRYVSRGMYKVD